VQGASLVCFAGRWAPRKRSQKSRRDAGATKRPARHSLHGIAKHLWRAHHAAPLRMLGEIKNNEWATDQRPSPDATFGTRTTRACSSALLRMFGETLRVGLRSANARGQKTR